MRFFKYIFLSLILLLGGFYALTASAATEHENTVQKAYIAYYGRPADPAGLDYWAGRLEAANGNLQELINDFGNSEEYNERFGNLDNETLIKNIYQNLFNRDPDPAGLAYYKAQLATGESTLANISLDILNGATGDDISLINNKMEVAHYYTDAVRNECIGYDTDKIVALLKTVGHNQSTESIKQSIAIEGCTNNNIMLRNGKCNLDNGLSEADLVRKAINHIKENNNLNPNHDGKVDMIVSHRNGKIKVSISPVSDSFSFNPVVEIDCRTGNILNSYRM